MKNKVRTVLTAAACISALLVAGAAGARDNRAPSSEPAAGAATRTTSAHLKADRQLLAMLSAPTRGSFSPARLNDDPDPGTCLSEGESCTADTASSCCSTYCAIDDTGSGHCTGR